ncbi:hypothetical protein [Frateuria sp. STR12]|uniref:hypothetical protein n=1 Tax=Frateuria hangzhouensis TaxID=2995589 RepID=UPI0022609074|nr:hypothetical protein [Frateuria sp. STR12]MCX7514050.1 hypothetical protein [Frateuria sp. STR12]
MRARSGWWWVLGLLLAAPACAQQVPPPLRDWQDWVLHDVPAHACPRLVDSPGQGEAWQCAWPGRLTLNADADGGRFTLDAHADAPSWIALPGDARSWPAKVQLDGQPAVVLERNDQPMVRVSPGDHRLQGQLPWQARPARLHVPDAIGLVDLVLDGKPVARVQRDGEQLTLGEAAAAQRVADALSLRVDRRLADGLPPTLQTQLRFDVTGSAREQLLGPVLPAGFVATALDGELPARLESDGRLRVQLKPGRWTIPLDARATAPLARIAIELPPAPWPKQEIWSYADQPDLRSSHAEGAAIDAAQAGVPRAWRELPAFVMGTGAALTVQPGERGAGQDDRLRLSRRLWLDFDGKHLGVDDRLQGELHRQRLEVGASWQLERAAQDGEPLVVSRGKDGRSGVEVRSEKLDLGAGLRVRANGAMPVTGWNVPLERIDATLQLPPGYRLLGAPGADRSPDSWLAQWSLLDVFGVALIALLAGRLLGWPWALLAAGFLALAQHEAGAPRWTLALLLALALLLRALPEGRLRRVANVAALAAFALVALLTLPFLAAQLQYALHPQLQPVGTHAGKTLYAPVREAAPVGPPPPPPPAPMAPPQDMVATVQSLPSVAPSAVNGSGAVSPEPSIRPPFAPGARGIGVPASSHPSMEGRSLIQAGTGTPGWRLGSSYHLGWSGPVTPQQTLRLVIAPAWLVSLLRVLMVALLAALLARLLPALLAPWRGRQQRGRGAAAAALLALALMPWHVHAQAMPSQTLLDQLRDRLVEAPVCAPSCASLPQARAVLAGDTLDLALQAHAGAIVALPLPDTSLPLLAVTVDGRPAVLARRGGDQLWLRLEPGVHELALRYRLDGTDSARLRFALAPQRVTVQAEGWAADGLDADRLLGDSLAFDRQRIAADGETATPAQDFPPYVRLTRRLVLGNEWTVWNEVERIAPQTGGFSVALPLLPGEHPLGADAPVRDGHIQLAFNAGTDSIGWSSRLDRAPELHLTAPALGERAEVWEIDAAPMWHVETHGVPASDGDGLRFQPLPAEQLSLAITQPPAVAGGTLAFDSVNVRSATGERATETTLVLDARSTRGGEHALGLPAGAELLQASRDSERLPLAIRNGTVSLPLLPGTHRYELRLRETGGAALHTRSPAVALHAPAANIDLILQLPQDRWVLWTWGPGAGPAVLYWAQLIVLLIAAWLLSRYAPTPLRFGHWLLLGLGFSAFAWSAYAVVVVWLVLLGLRARAATTAWRTGVFDLMQVGLVLLTAVALAVLVAAVPGGLLGQPDMHIAGMGSSAAQLRWFADRSADALPRAGVFSLPLWTYKLAMLAWALWLANALIGWLRWGFEAWSRDGYWRRDKPQPAMPPQLPTATETPPDA